MRTGPRKGPDSHKVKELQIKIFSCVLINNSDSYGGKKSTNFIRSV